MADPRPTNTGFDPQFGDPLKKWRDYLESQGIQTNIISGVRSEQEHQMAWENFLAGQQGRPLPYPDFGPVSKATPPGETSTHDVGLGADVQPVNRADLPKMYASAPRFGIAFQGASDPYHFNLGNWRQAEATQARPTPWTQVADIPSSYAMNAEANAPSQPRTGAPAAGSSFFDALHQIESNNRNIYSGVDKDYPGQPNSRSQGYDQIDLPTWRQFAKQAGVDLTQYPTPMSAPPGVQDQVASQIPLSRFGQRTQNMLAHQFGQLDTSKTVGQLSSQFTPTGTNINNTAASPAAPTATAGAPTAGADGAAAPGAPTAAFGSAGNLPGFQPNSPAAKMTAAGLDQLKKGMGIGDSGGGDEKPPAMAPLPTPPPAMPSGGPMMLGSGGMNTFGRNAAEQQIAQQGFMTQPSIAAFNTAPPMLPTPGPAMPGGMTGVTGLPGTTLNSPSALQTAMLYGSLDPFDPYGRYSNASNYGSA